MAIPQSTASERREGGVEYVSKSVVSQKNLGDLTFPYLLRVVAIFSGVLVAMITVLLLVNVYEAGFIVYLQWFIDLFPPGLEILGFLFGLVTFMGMTIGIQLIITYLITRFLLSRYEERIIIQRTRIQHKVGQILKYFSQGLFLALLIALLVSPFWELYPSGDWTLGLALFSVLVILIVYLGSTVGNLITDMYFYYHYRKEIT